MATKMNRVRGFSLIEMMVVMAIMGLVISVVTLSGGFLSAVFSDGRAASAEAFADELLLLMATASAEAILSGEPVALGFLPPSVQQEEGVAVTWLRYARVAGESVRSREPMWQSVSAQTGLRDLYMSPAISSELAIEGEVVNIQALTDSDGMPAVVFYPTGETTGFNWWLSHDGQVVTLANEGSGGIERRRP